jgi:4-amino-4-deoxy-L-arabinose transferase-like glycosyltransferase
LIAARLHLPARPAWSWGDGSLALRRVVAVVVLAAILVPALVLRLDAATGRAHRLSADEKAYLAVAAGIRQHGVYGNRVLDHPFHWAPGAPALFALADAVSGHPADGSIDRRAARNAQAVVGTLTVVAAFALAALLGGLWVGLIAAAAVAFYPPAIGASALLVSEPLGALAITGALAAVVWAVRRGGALRAGVAGAALGVACLTRADVLLGALVVVVGIAVAAWRAAARGSGLRAGAAALAGLLLLLAPWTVFASRRAHAFVPITDGGSSTLFIATYLPGHGTIFGLKHALHAELVRRHPRYRHVPIQRISSRAFLNTVAQRHPGLGHDAAISAELRRNLHVYVLGHPVAFAKLTATKIGRMWGAPFRGTYHHSGALPLWTHRVLLALALLGLLGGLWRRRTAPLVLVALGLLVIAAVNVAFVAEARHAFRLMPALIAAGAAGWAGLAARPREPA